MESGTPSRDTAWAMSEENVEVVLEAFGRFTIFVNQLIRLF
jgi:hypothetical protein